MYKLLLVEDEHLERQAIRFIIDRSCPEFSIVGEAGDGVLALELAARTRPDIILMDIQMPRMSGLEAARHLRLMLPAAKIIIISAADSDSCIEEANRLGIAEYILKPVRPDHLVRILRAEAKTIIRSKQAIAL